MLALNFIVLLLLWLQLEAAEAARGHAGGPPLVEPVCSSLGQLDYNDVADSAEMAAWQLELIGYSPYKVIQVVF